MPHALFYGGPLDMNIREVDDPPPLELRVAIPPRPRGPEGPVVDPWSVDDPMRTDGWVAEYVRVAPHEPHGAPRYVWRR